MKERLRQASVWILWGVFSVFIYLYVFYFADASIIHFQQDPLFLANKFFLQKYLAYPGGFAEYVSQFFSQFYSINVVGSIIITCLVLLTACLVDRLTKSKSGYPGLGFLLSALILVNLQSFYNFSSDILFVFISSLLASLAYSKIHSKALVYKTGFILFVNPLLLYFFGGSAVLAFSLIISAKILFDREAGQKLAFLTIQWIIVLGGLLLIARWSPYINFEMAIKGVFFKKSTEPYFYQLIALFVLVPVIILFFSIGSAKIFQRKVPLKAATIVKQTSPFLMVLLLVLSFYLSYDSLEKNKIAIHSFAAEGNWRKVIELGETLPLSERVVLFEINRALFYKGCLLEDAFKYPQYYGESGLILTPTYTNQVLYLCSELYHQMGYAKGSLHWAYEAQTKFEFSPKVLKRIAEDNIVLGDYLTAAKFVKILSQSPMHKSWAEEYEQYLYNDSLVLKNDFLRYSREMLVEKQFYANTHSPHKDMIFILEEHPTNKMAFEYLMLGLMLNHDLGNLAKYVTLINSFNYKKLPRYLEEALIVLQALDGNSNRNYPISEETIGRFKKFTKLLAMYKKDKRYKAEMTRYYKDTYWYYIHFLSPLRAKSSN